MFRKKERREEAKKERESGSSLMIHRVQGRDVLLTAQSCEGFLVFVVHNLFRLRFLVCSLFSLFLASFFVSWIFRTSHASQSLQHYVETAQIDMK